MPFPLRKSFILATAFPLFIISLIEKSTKRNHIDFYSFLPVVFLVKLVFTQISNQIRYMNQVSNLGENQMIYYRLMFPKVIAFLWGGKTIYAMYAPVFVISF